MSENRMSEIIFGSRLELHVIFGLSSVQRIFTLIKTFMSYRIVRSHVKHEHNLFNVSITYQQLILARENDPDLEIKNIELQTKLTKLENSRGRIRPENVTDTSVQVDDTVST